MKRTLLLCAAGLLAHIGSHAQGWEYPRLETSEFAAGQEFYLYNVHAGKFYTEGNAYGTQGSLGPTGLKCRFEENPEAPSVVSISNYSVAKGEWMTPYITTNGALYVDGISQADRYWQVVPQGDNTYKLMMSSPNPVYNQENYPGALLGLDTFEDSTRTVLACLLMEAEEPGEGVYQTDWYLATPEAYKKFQTDVETYKTALSLGELLKEAISAEKDVEEEQAVYDNTASTMDELNAAIGSVTEKLIGGSLEDASEDHPVDVTDLFITNPTYDTNSNEGWSGSVPGLNAAANAQNAEFFYTDFDYYQNLKNLPEGYYLVSLQGFYRAGLPAEALTHKQEGEDGVMYAELYATTGGSTSTTPLQSIFDGATAEPLGTEGEIRNGDYYTPDGMTAAAAYFAAGRYEGNQVLVHVTDGQLRIGIRKNTTIRRDWVMFDNWSLTYYGTEKPNL